MADKHEEATRKKAVAAEYENILIKHREKVKESLSKSQYDFLINNRQTANDIYSNLVTAMKEPNIIPSKYVSKNLAWLFDLAIPRSEMDLILYFADRLQDYPYSDSYVRRSFRAKWNGAYALKLANIISDYGSSYTALINEPLEKILNPS